MNLAPPTAAASVIGQMRELLLERAGQLDRVAVHVTELQDIERPRDARRMVRRLRSCADRARAVAMNAASSGDRICDACEEALELQQECSRFLVRNGVRGVLVPEQFAAIDDAVVLVGELAKAGFGMLVVRRQRSEPSTQRHVFEHNPLHAFAPVIADALTWARRNLDPTEDDRRELIGALSRCIVDVFDGARTPNPFVCPTTHMTADALNLAFIQWGLRSDEHLMAAFDDASVRAVAALDGASVDSAVLGVWFGIGVAAGIMRMLLVAAHPIEDTADATLLIQALDPGRYEAIQAYAP